MSSSKPHVVLVPCPLYGHINPMFKLAKILHHYGFHITFVNTEFMQKRVLESTLESLPPSFRFETIPDGLAEDDLCRENDGDKLFHSISITCLDPFRKLLVKLNNDDTNGVPPVSGIISDVVMGFTVKAGGELDIPVLVFWAVSVFASFTSSKFGPLIEKGYLPLKDENMLTNGYLDTVIEDVPGLEGMRLRDLPSYMISVNEIPYSMKIGQESDEKTYEASRFISNTFNDLESSALEGMLSVVAPSMLYSIGPLHLLEKQVCDNKDLKENGPNLWKEDTECLEWLDSKEPNSVIYVNFGTTGFVTHDKLVEFAWGLANSNQSFLWIVRPNLVHGDKAVLTKEFIESTKERGMLASWCPQEKVLSHSSVGGFLTHSGWNSVLESICCGVPMICWPLAADQPTNCWACCNKWGIGLELNDVKRDVVENLVRTLLTGNEGKEMKKKVMELKKLAHNSVKNSSLVNLEKVMATFAVGERINHA